MVWAEVRLTKPNEANTTKKDWSGVQAGDSPVDLMLEILK